MKFRLLEFAISCAFVFVAGIAIWPPENVYWNIVVTATSFSTTLAVVMVLCGLIGAGFASWTGVSIVNFVLGGILAYGVGMGLLVLVVSPFQVIEYAFLYVVILCWFVVGAMAATVIRSRRAEHAMRALS